MMRSAFPRVTASQDWGRSWKKIPLVGSVIMPLLLLFMALLGEHLPMPTITPAPLAGESSVYVPGAGFSGFWYHMGLFHALPANIMHQHDYYCYSSACLSVVLGFLQAPVQDTYHVCRSMQQAWVRGEMSTYDMVDEFLHRLVPHDEAVLRPWLSRVHVISTTLNGVEIRHATNRTELVQLLQRTTWIPFLTGQDWVLGHSESDDTSLQSTASGSKYYLDGYFSVPLHPTCRRTARVPFSWSMYFHSLNPAVGEETVLDFVQQGRAQIDSPFQVNRGWTNTTIL